MVERNINFTKLQGGYLFPEINRRRRLLLEREPKAKVISLGVGDTTEPLKTHIAGSLERAAGGLMTEKGFTGYGDEQGLTELRERIAKNYYSGLVKPEEVFVSDGAKCDIGRIQFLFGPAVSIAVQDPSYPVYVDSGVIVGQTGEYQQEAAQFEGITYLTCTPENQFFPDLSRIQESHVIYFCSPNNPTGAVADRSQLCELVRVAEKTRSILVFDAAYALFIQDGELPRSIFEIDGARRVAIEVNSFSKSAGFTGVRLGWTVVPDELSFDDGTPVHNDWNRLTGTLFNGASNIVQQGGLAALDEEGMSEMKESVAYYMQNAAIIRTGLDELGFESYGGSNAPYIWTRFPGKTSWDAFEELLEKSHIVTTPGSGFGPAGEGFVRFSAFGHRADVEEAVNRLSH
jgi:LL-diaminopimelate aminotransferase